MRALYSVWVIKLEKQRKGIKKKQQQPQRRQKGDRILNVKSRVERVLLSHRIVKTETATEQDIYIYHTKNTQYLVYTLLCWCMFCFCSSKFVCVDCRIHVMLIICAFENLSPSLAGWLAAVPVKIVFGILQKFANRILPKIAFNQNIAK